MFKAGAGSDSETLYIRNTCSIAFGQIRFSYNHIQVDFLVRNREIHTLFSLRSNNDIVESKIICSGCQSRNDSAKVQYFYINIVSVLTAETHCDINIRSRRFTVGDKGNGIHAARSCKCKLTVLSGKTAHINAFIRIIRISPVFIDFIHRSVGDQFRDKFIHLFAHKIAFFRFRECDRNIQCVDGFAQDCKIRVLFDQCFRGLFNHKKIIDTITQKCRNHIGISVKFRNFGIW